jgi:hypothetical protein
MHKTNLIKPTEAEQHQRFVETARALECDEDKERFEETLGKIAAHKPKNEGSPEPAAKKTRKKAK